MEMGIIIAAKKAEELSNGAAYVVFGGTTAAVIIGENKMVSFKYSFGWLSLKKNQHSFAQTLIYQAIFDSVFYKTCRIFCI